VIRVNGKEHDICPVSVVGLLEQLHLEPRGIAVARNGEIVRRSEWSSTILQNGDAIEVVTAAAGG
jgi:sulfur carrier protein